MTNIDKEIYNRTIVLKLDAQGFIYKYIKESNMRTIYKNKNNILSRIFIRYNLPGKTYFLNDWKKEIKNLDNVIIFDNGYNTILPKYIKKKNKNCKIIVFCWNLLDSESAILKDNKYIDEVYSFDLGQVEKYNFKFNNSFYTKDLVLKEQPIEWDLFFLGLDKGREKRINDIKEQCEKMNINNNFKIIKSSSDYIDYDTYIELLNRSEAVLDITKEGQRGLTVRSMECLFLKKKLITDNKDIKRFNFYRKNNIFILGEDNIEKLKEFIESPYENVEQSIIDEYDYKNWCLRMLRGEEQAYEK